MAITKSLSIQFLFYIVRHSLNVHIFTSPTTRGFGLPFCVNCMIAGPFLMTFYYNVTDKQDHRYYHAQQSWRAVKMN